MSKSIKYSTKARQRRLDPFACPQKISSLLEQLIKETYTELNNSYISLEQLRENNYELLVHLLQRASNFIRSGSKSKPNKKSDKIPNQTLLKIIATMKEILVKETQNRISFRTFTDNYLRLLSCPEDIKQWLATGKIRLFEALQLKRLSAENLQITDLEAKAIRAAFFEKYSKEKWIIHRLREEVDLKLGKTPIETSSFTENKITNEDNFISPLEPSIVTSENFFKEQIYSMIEMLNSLEIQELSSEEQNKLLTQVDNVVLYLQKILKRQQKLNREHKTEKVNLGFL